MDHGGMDHGGMDHGGMDHGGSGGGMKCMGNMAMLWNGALCYIQEDITCAN